MFLATHGVLRNPTAFVPPTFANTLSTYFDGVADRVEINNTLGSGFSELSISTWVKYNNNVATSNQYHPIVAKIGPSFGHSFQLANMRSGASSNGGELYFNVHTPNGSFTTFSGVVPSQNVWYNIVGTYDGSNVKIYIDGVLKGTLSASGNINSNTEPLMLGDAGYGGYSQFLNGNLDEVSIYSRGLTQSEVTSIYNGGAPNDVSTISDIEAWWRMGDGDTANTITDNVGTNDGTMVNMNAGNFVTDVPTIPFNTKSIELDGIADYIRISDADNLSFGDGSTDSPFSISAWANFTDISSGGIFAKLNTSSRREYGFYISSSKVRFLVYSQGNTNKYIGRRNNTALTSYENQWIHLLATYDGSSLHSGLKIYLNGTRIDDTDVSQGTYVAMQNDAADAFIGRLSTTYTEGAIDEVGIFSSELSASDVTAIYNSGLPTDLSSYSSLVSWWRCGDSDTAPTLTDNGSGGNDGTMVSFSTFSTDVP